MVSSLSRRYYKLSQQYFLLKNIIWTRIFFKHYKMISLKKNKKKSLLKKDANHPKIVWHSRRQRKNIEKREKKLKNEKKSNNNNKYFLLLPFYVEKIIFCWEIHLIQLYYSFFAGQVIRNEVIKHHHPYRYALVA